MQELLAWKAPEHYFFPKSPRWYVAIVVLALIAVVVAIFQANFMFLLFIIIALVVILFLANNTPKMMECALSDEGIAVIREGLTEESAEEGEFYAYPELSGFAIHHNPLDTEYSEIILRKKEKLSTYIKIMIADHSALKAKEILDYYLPEFEYEESFSDHLLKRIGL